MKITNKKFVAASYDLYVGGEEGQAPELMEKATEEIPLTFIFGTGMMLESFESQLENLQTGDSFDFILPSESAYGEYNEERVAELPKTLFEVEGKFDEENIAVDKMVPMMTADGQRLDGMVLEITDESVRMDFNHPLAGEDLHFIGKVLEVRDATNEEIEQTMSSCCSCGSDCDGDHDHEEGCGNGGCCCS